MNLVSHSEDLEERSVNSYRWLAVWLGSFLMVGTVLFFYFNVPLLPILLAGGITLFASFIKFRSK